MKHMHYFIHNVVPYTGVTNTQALKWFTKLCEGEFQSVFYEVHFHGSKWRLWKRHKARKALLSVLQPEMMRSMRALELLFVLYIRGIDWKGLDPKMVIPDVHGNGDRIVQRVLASDMPIHVKNRFCNRVTVLGNPNL